MINDHHLLLWLSFYLILSSLSSHELNDACDGVLTASSPSLTLFEQVISAHYLLLLWLLRLYR